MSEVRKAITVGVRVRPDTEEKNDPILTTNGTRVEMKGGAPRHFDVDKTYDGSTTNAQIYTELIDPLIARLLSGYNVFVIAYGTSGSGKGHTLYGDKMDPDGCITRAVESIFTKLDAAKATVKHLVTISAYQIRATSITDLLNPSTHTSLQLHDHRSLGAYVDGIAELYVETSGECKEYIRQAMAAVSALDARTTHSGRHVIIDIRVEQIEPDNPYTIKYGTMRWVHVAGSGGVTLKFDQNLQSFTRCIDGLAAEKDAWSIPYNQSKLTRLLEPALGGNGFTTAILFVEAKDKGAADTLQTLELGEKLRKIKNSARVNKNTTSAAIRELREEIKKVRGKLNLTQPGQYVHDIDPQNIKILKQLITELERVKKQTWESKRAASTAMIATRIATLKAEGLSDILIEDIKLPENLVKSSQSLLQTIIVAKQNVEDTNQALEEKRSLYRVRAKKQAESGEETKDDKLTALQSSITSLESTLTSQTNDLHAQEEEFRKIMIKIVTMEAKQKKIFLQEKDAASLDTLNKNKEWTEMRKEMSSDSTLTSALETIQRTHDDAARRADGNDALIKQIDAVKEYAEQAKKMEWERDHLWGKLIEQKFRHEAQMNRFQEHMFFMFRHYRSHFEDTKTRIETRYRELLENSVNDALRLAEENHKLKMQLENKQKTL